MYIVIIDDDTFKCYDHNNYLEMNGKKEVKYYKYPNTSGRVSIPADIGDILDWRNKDKLKVIIKTIDGHTGLFIYKNEKKKKE